MKFPSLLSVALMAVILSLNAQAQTAAPLTWNSYIDVLGNYLLSDSQGNVVSRFTPGVAVTVTRVQLQAGRGSYINGQHYTKCSPVPKIKVTDETTRYVLAI